MNKLAVGTVQFGLPYGIANSSGQVSDKEVKKILELAENSAITTLDTAIAYGESEAVLGRQNLSSFSVITKLPEVPESEKDVAAWANQQLKGSLDRLHLSSLDSLLLHRPAQLVEPRGDTLYRQLQELKHQGLVQRIGISIYSPEELDSLCKKFQFDVVQAPFNILDNRLAETGWLKRLKNMGTSLHVRSVFMQGLLLMDRQQRPEKFARWSDTWERWEKWLQETGQPPLQACLRHVLSIPEIEKVVVGVDSAAQLNQIIKASEGFAIPPPDNLTVQDKSLLNPSCWNSL